MTQRRPCPAAPGPLEGYAARFDDPFASLAQQRGFREYLAGLLAPRDRNKTLTALAGAEPVTGAQHAAVQRLQFFLSESRWDPEQVNARRLELLRADPATAPHGGGVLVVDDSGDWHTASGYGVRSCPETKQGPGWLGGISNTAVVLGLRGDCWHGQDNQHEKRAPEDVVWVSWAQCFGKANPNSNDGRQHYEGRQYPGALRSVGRPSEPRQLRRWVGGAQYRYLASEQSGTDEGQRACRAPPDERHYVMMARFGELPPVVGLSTNLLIRSYRRAPARLADVQRTPHVGDG